MHKMDKKRESKVPKQVKRSESKVPKQVKDNPGGVEQAKKPISSGKKPKPVSEIDEIFAGKRKNKTPQTEKATNAKEETPSSSSAKKPTNVIDGSFTGLERMRKAVSAAKLKRKEEDRGLKDGGFGDMPSRSKKRTADGFVIYTEDELGINKADAGSTRLCPFDCECCF